MIKGSKVLIMGLAYTKNLADMRESYMDGIVEELSKSVARVAGGWRGAWTSLYVPGRIN